MEKRFKFGWLGVLVVSLVFILLLSLGLVYQYGGLKYHFHATSFMKNLPADQKAAVEADFYGTQPDVYNCILAGVLGDNVWAWGKTGLRHFKVDEFAGFFFTDGCTEEILNPTDKTKGFSLKRQTLDLAGWTTKVRQGDYVTIYVGDGSAGYPVGVLREVYALNWWQFMHKDMQTACAK